MRIKVYFLIFGVLNRSRMEAEGESPSSSANIWKKTQLLSSNFVLAVFSPHVNKSTTCDRQDLGHLKVLGDFPLVLLCHGVGDLIRFRKLLLRNEPPGRLWD